MKEDSEEVFGRLEKDTSIYLKLKLELLKLNTYERMGKIISFLSYGLILIFLVLFMCLFIFLALGVFIGDCLDSIALGFLTVSVIYLLLIALARLYETRICEKIMNIIIASLMANDVKEDEPFKEQIDTDSGADL